MTIIHVSQRSLRKGQAGWKEFKVKKNRPHIFQTTCKRFPSSPFAIRYTEQNTSYHTNDNSKISIQRGGFPHSIHKRSASWYGSWPGLFTWSKVQKKEEKSPVWYLLDYFLYTCKVFLIRFSSLIANTPLLSNYLNAFTEFVQTFSCSHLIKFKDISSQLETLSRQWVTSCMFQNILNIA